MSLSEIGNRIHKRTRAEIERRRPHQTNAPQVSKIDWERFLLEEDFHFFVSWKERDETLREYNQHYEHDHQNTGVDPVSLYPIILCRGRNAIIQHCRRHSSRNSLGCG